MKDSSFKNKTLIVFDLDLTLTKSKSPITSEMASLLSRLLERKKVAIISGGTFEQMQTQVVSLLPERSSLRQLFLLPTSGTSLYVYNNEWDSVYREDLTEVARVKIKDAITQTLEELLIPKPNTLYGEQIDDRVSQITFSALGQNAPLEAKKEWDPDLNKRKKMLTMLEKKIPEFDVKIGGSTSIDVTKKGVDKGYGLTKLLKYLKLEPEKVLFIGDRLEEFGNDYSVRDVGVSWYEVSDPEETKQILSVALE